MKIGIDARMLGPAQGGIGRYIQELVSYLEELVTDRDPSASPQDDKLEFVVFLRRENWDLYEPAVPNFRKVLAPYHWYGWQEQLLFPRVLKRENCDLVHFPHWNIPLSYNRPFVVTIHDLLLLDFPTREASLLGPISYAIKYRGYRAALKHAAEKSRAIIAASEFTKKTIVEKLHVPAEKITVTYQAPFNAESSNVSIAETEKELLSNFGIERPYVLCVSNNFPHKNIPGLLAGWELFQQKYGSQYPLVIVGPANFFQKKNKKLAEEKNIGNIIFTGLVSDEELTILYRQALLYVFPSLYEGFGLPPLEALAEGLPVASANTTCLPEVLGEAATYFDPTDPTAIADTIFKGLTDSALRQTLILNSKTLLLKYSWQTLAEKTLALYRKSA